MIETLRVMSQKEQAMKTAEDPQAGQWGVWLEGRKGQWPGEAERAWGMKVQDQRQGGGEETSPASSESCKTEPGEGQGRPRAPAQQGCQIKYRMPTSISD